MQSSNLLSEIIVEELYRLGCSTFCLAYGSRSTPLIHAVAKHTHIQSHLHYDERGLGFYALGQGKALKKPTPLIVTSGSSLANLYPAVVEAFQDQIPLLLLTADRPYELRDCSSNQTLNQVDFFKNYVHWHQDLPLFETHYSLPFICSTLGIAYAKSLKGPVHLNFQFREPFLKETYKPKGYEEWKEKKKPSSVYIPEAKTLFKAKTLDANQNGILICGKHTEKESVQDILKLSEQLNWPILPDLLSNLKFEDHPHIISHYDPIIKYDSDLKVDSVIQFGGAYLSKPLLQFLDKQNLSSYISVYPYLQRVDPNHKVTEQFECSTKSFCSQIEILSSKDKSWVDLWKKRDCLIQTYLESFFEETLLSEPSVIREVFKNALKGDLLFIGASMPIRDAHLFAKSSSCLKIFANRGASGIDGNLATALGISAALDKPITIILGDLTFLHDCNSLPLIQNLKHPPKIIILNNAGGGIFSFLPISQDQTVLKRYFQGEHSFSFASIAKQFNLEYLLLEEDLTLLKEKPLSPILIEVKTNSSENLALHQKIERGLKTCLNSISLETQTTLR